MKVYVSCEHKIPSLIHIDGLTSCPNYMYVSEARELDSGVDIKKYLDDNPDISHLYIAPDDKTAQKWAQADNVINTGGNCHGFILKNGLHGYEQACQIITIPRIDKKISIGYSYITKTGYIKCYSLDKGLFLYQEPFAKDKPLNMRPNMHFEEKQIFNAVANKYSKPNYRRKCS